MVVEELEVETGKIYFIRDLAVTKYELGEIVWVDSCGHKLKPTYTGRCGEGYHAQFHPITN